MRFIIIVYSYITISYLKFCTVYESDSDWFIVQTRLFHLYLGDDNMMSQLLMDLNLMSLFLAAKELAG